MKPGKLQTSKQRCLDLCWKVYNPAQSLVRPYTMPELCNQNVSIGQFLSKQLLCFVHGQGEIKIIMIKKSNK